MSSIRIHDIPQRTSRPKEQFNVPWSAIETNLDMFSKNIGLDLEPDFQRSHVWTPEQRTRYMEFKLSGGEDVSPITFNSVNYGRPSEGRLQLLDGLQRLTTARMFMRNEVPVFDGHFLRDFEDIDVGRGPLPSCMQFTFAIHTLPTRQAVLQRYLEINDAGTPHSPQELERVADLLVLEVEELQAAADADLDDGMDRSP